MLTLIAIYVSFASVFGVVMVQAFGGKTPSLQFALFLAVVNFVLWWLVADNFPFVVGVA
jgi:hypothetical protein